MRKERERESDVKDGTVYCERKKGVPGEEIVLSWENRLARCKRELMFLVLGPDSSF